MRQEKRTLIAIMIMVIFMLGVIGFVFIDLCNFMNSHPGIKIQEFHSSPDLIFWF